MRLRRRMTALPVAAAVVAAVTLIAACSSSNSSSSSSGTGTGTANSTASAASGTTTIGVDLTYNSTAFWAAYINYETQYASQLHIKLLGPLLAAANASLQNQQIQDLVNEGAKAIIVNPETATSLGPAIAYASAHHVQLISVDTIVGVGKVYMVVRASNTIYGLDACAYISSKVKSGYVLDLEGDLTSSNGADRTNAFDQCMTANDPNVHVLKDPTVWTEATAVTDAQNAVNAYGSDLKAIYAQWSSPDLGVLPLLASKHLTGKVILVGYGASAAALAGVASGAWYGDVAQAPASEGRLAVQALVKALRTGQDSGGIDPVAQLPDNGIVTKANVSQFTAEWPG